MVVASLGPQLPLIHGPASALGLHPVFGGQMLGEEPMLVGSISEEGRAAAIPHRHREPGVDEGLPKVGVKDHVPYRPLGGHVRHSPIVPDSITGAALVFGEWLARGAYEAAVAGQHQSGMG
jgi:hypothetical protein